MLSNDPSLFGDAVWFTAADCSLAEFEALVEQATDIRDYPCADRVDQGAVVYGDKHDFLALSESDRYSIRTEFARALGQGPGVIVVKRAFDLDVIDGASAVFFDLIDRQKGARVETGDHFAAPGTNDRLWAALEKLALADAELFCEYFGHELIALASTAWLGPSYRVVSEINSVNPEARAQMGHRDYHMGMMDLEHVRSFPAHVHRFSAALTLQIGVAHVDMPIEAGPTMYLPHSHKYDPGYLALNLPEFQRYFEDNRRQLPLEKGDAIIFNPSVVHAAGANETSDVRRMVNLLQISSAFGRSSAAVDTARVLIAIYPVLRARFRAEHDRGFVQNLLDVATDGYPFPTNLDRDRPGDSLIPESQTQLAMRALTEDWDPHSLATALADQKERRRSSLEAW
jgi:ectoine hydroxylase-related dioxygenase (phytanoyl-CoA dioxygenase family)